MDKRAQFFTCIALGFILLFAGCNAPATPENPTGENNDGLYADEKDYIPSVADNYTVGEKPEKTWWSFWARYSNHSTANAVDEIYADAATTVVGVHDAGLGPYYREQLMRDGVNWLKQFRTLGLKGQVCIEGFGDSRNVLLALHKKPDGSFEWDDELGGAKIYADNWTWDYSGPFVNNDANYFVWSGLPSYFNKAPWQGKYMFDEKEMPIPTYPDGRPALGYKNNIETPDMAILFDACGAKDINGNYLTDFVMFADEQATPDNLTRHKVKMPDGSIKYAVGDFAVGKDENAPIWLEYARSMARYFIEKGVDGFWTDNYLGWNSLGNSPIEKAFGEWSKFKFKEYLKAHPEVGVKDPESFDVVKYLKSKYLELSPDGNPDDISWGNGAWRDPRWLEDPVWKAFLCFKSDSIYEASSKFYSIVKEEAKKAGKNPDDIAVTGNDFCFMHGAAVDGTTLDVVSTEYNPVFNVVTGMNWDGLPPKGRIGGLCAILSQCAKSRHSSIWYYASQKPASYSMGKVVGYQALAHNQTINSGTEMENGVGTNKSAREVNKSIGKLRDLFGDRDKYAEIAVYYSSNSEYSQLAPGGYVGGDNLLATAGYLGWTYAFDILNVPYKAIYEFNLDKMIGSTGVLIMPGTTSIRRETVEKTLKEFLDRGGTLVITGENPGSIDTKEGLYMPHGSSLLDDLAKSYKGKGKVIRLEFDPAAELYRQHLQADETGMQQLKAPIVELLEGLYKEGRLNKLLEISGFNQNTVTTLNLDPYTDTFCVDIVNMDIDVAADKITPTSGHIKAKLPKALFGKPLKVQFFSADKREFVEVTPKISGGYIELDVPQFEVYCSLIVSPAESK